MLPSRRLLVIFLALAACGDDDPAEAPTVFIDGLSADATVFFDDAGVLHARCATDEDCVAVEGYYHAAHRFFQMDLRRRLGRGRLSELVGSVTLATDQEWIREMTTRDGRPLEEVALESANDETRAAFEAYSRGVNAWLEDARNGENGAVLSAEYDFSLLLPQRDLALATDWEPLDSAAAALPLVRVLTDHAMDEIVLGEAYAALEPEVATDLFGQRPSASSSVLAAGLPSEAERPLDDPGAAALRDRLALIEPLLTAAAGDHTLAPVGASGSNNWAVAPDKAGGKALLANDPHLTLSHPSIWYMVHLDAVTAGSGTLQIAGMSYPGLPGVVLGQNAEIAWGATTTRFDAADVYVETLGAGGDTVLFDGGEVGIERVERTIAVANSEPVPFTVEVVPHHGPILARDDAGGTAMSLRWTGHDMSTDLDFLLALGRASTVEEARAALENVTTIGQNFVVVDRAGSIGWFPYNRLPRRPWASLAVPPWLPLPGDGSAEWDGYYDLSELPQSVDPAEGYIATANNDMTGAYDDGDPTNDAWPLQRYPDPGFRHQRIIERLAERDDHDLASMQAIQADVFSIPGRELVPVLLADTVDATLGPAASSVRQALASWKFTCPSGLATSDPDGAASDDADERAEAAGCAAFHTMLGRLRALTFDDDLGDLSMSEIDDAVFLAFLEPDALHRTYWDDVTTVPSETRAEIVALAMAGAGEFLADELGAEVDDWIWGRLHTMSLRADLFDAAGLKDYNGKTVARDGGPYLVDVAHPEDERDDEYGFVAGASVRWTCEASAVGVACAYELPGGQRHLVGSPFFDSLFDAWLANRPTPLELDLDVVEQRAVEHVVVGRAE